jgi:hypothetical protein
MYNQYSIDLGLLTIGVFRLSLERNCVEPASMILGMREKATQSDCMAWNRTQSKIHDLARRSDQEPQKAGDIASDLAPLQHNSIIRFLCLL